MRLRTHNHKRRAAMWKRPVSDCGDDGCGECDVCRYLHFLEWASSASGGVASYIQRHTRIERHIKEHYPHVAI